ncbi:MAG: ABC transporter permease subunit [Gemmatimonadota bacterium]
MTAGLRVARAAFREAVRVRTLVGVVLVLAGGGELFIRFGGGGMTTFLSLLEATLVVVPLVGLVLGTLQVHQGRRLMEVLLAQPIRRHEAFTGLFLASSLPLAVTAGLGVLLPFAWHGLLWGPLAGPVLALAGAATLLTVVTTALAYLIALGVEDRVRAVGLAAALWVVTVVLWDGVVLLVALLGADRAGQVPVLALLALNPVDLTRVLLLQQLDAGEVLGYTGAVLRRMTSATAGRVALSTLLMAWLALPLWSARRMFARKDF